MPAQYGATDSQPPPPPLSTTLTFSSPPRDAERGRTMRTSYEGRAPRPSLERRRSRLETHQPGASVLSSVSNLANTIIGSGALAFPAAFASMGMVSGIVSCLFSASTATFGLWLLSRCALLVGQRPGDEGRMASFNEVARLAFGKGWVMRLFDFAIAIKCFGVSVSYLIICKTLLPQVSETFAHLFHTELAPDSILLSPHFWLLCTVPVIVPLSFMRTLDSLKTTSQIALSSVFYMVIVVVGWYFVKGPSPERGEIVPIRFDSATLASFPVQVFAFTCAQNLFPIYNELKERSQAKMNTIIASSIFGAASVYEILGVVGYLTFGSKVSSNVIAMYPADSLVVAIGRLGIVFLVGLSYPLQALPCRSCIYLLQSGIIKGKKAPAAIASARLIADGPAAVGYETQGLGNGNGNGANGGGGHGEGWDQLPPRRSAEASPLLSQTLTHRHSVDSPRASVDGDGEDLFSDSDSEMGNEEELLVPKVGDAGHGGAAAAEMPRKKFVGFTVLIVGLGYLIASLVDEMGTVLAWVGSTGSTIISFILPGLFYWRLFRNEPGPTKYAALALGIYGFAVMGFCLSMNIWALGRGKAPKS